MDGYRYRVLTALEMGAISWQTASTPADLGYCNEPATFTPSTRTVSRENAVLAIREPYQSSSTNRRNR